MEHNIYDLTSDSAKAYFYCEASRPYTRKRRWFHFICIFLLFAGGMCESYFILKYEHSEYFLLHLCIYGIWIFCLQLLLFGHISDQIRKKGDIQAAHDYNYDYYVHSKIKKKHAYLLVMAENQLRLGQSPMADHALQMINRGDLNKEEMYRYYLLSAIAAKGSGEREKQEKYIEFCNMVQSSSILLSPDMTVEELMEKLGTRQKAHQARSRMRKAFLIITWLTVFAFYFLLEAALPETIEYRRWFHIGGHLTFWITAVLLFYWFLMNICRFNRKRIDSGVLRGLFLVCCILMGFLSTITAGAFTLGDLLNEKEEQDNGDGTLTVTAYAGYHDSYSYLYRKNGIFLREYIGLTDVGDIAQPYNRSSVPASTESEDEGTDASATESSSENDILQDEKLLSEVYRAIYEETGNDLSYELQYSAKGVLYLSTDTKETDAGTVSWRIVYDRESENGACSEFVYYKDTDSNGSVNTEILNFYAYVHKDKRIIAANKTNWGSGGDQAYRDATGE